MAPNAANADRSADPCLVLLPTAPKVQEGPVLEASGLIRDEMSDMVWAVERTIPDATGVGMSGSEAGDETLAYHRRLLATWLEAHPGQAVPVAAAAPIRYQVMNSVPENWIPFIPVHVPGDSRQIQLQRAAMPRVLEGDPDPPEKVRPRTTVLRVGLDQRPPVPLFVHEEEVPRAGVVVSQAYRRTRWRNGRVVVWLGARKQSGRGEGKSGLAFDRLVDTSS
jgi:hypothetical protein